MSNLIINGHEVKVGEHWKSHDGQKWRILATDASGLFCIVAMSDEMVTRFTDKGFWGINEGDRLDLKEPWKEPQRGVLWMNIHPSLNGGGYVSLISETKANAEKHPGKDRLACIRVEWVEGQFDE